MDEQQIRLLVRQAIARHLGAPGAAPAAVATPMALPSLPTMSSQPAAAADAPIASHQFVILRPAGETDCIIEPSVACNHCGYCLCYGH